jgi:hypothetical protein
MCLRFAFLLIARAFSWLRLSQREDTWKTAEILILRHQLAVLQRQQPRRPSLNWADRALLATLLSVIPKARRHGMRLLVTPDTILRWREDLVRRRWAARSRHGKTGRPATRLSIKALVLRLARENPRMGLPADPRRAGRPGSTTRPRRGRWRAADLVKRDFPVAAHAVAIVAGAYELTPLRQHVRRRCHGNVDGSGLGFGLCHAGSSIGRWRCWRRWASSPSPECR